MPENNEEENNIDHILPRLFISSSGIKWQENIEKEFSGLYREIPKVESTGIIDEPKQINYIKYPFDRYTITVAVSANNEFLGITEVQLNEDFRNYKLKPSSQFSLEVEDFYFEK